MSIFTRPFQETTLNFSKTCLANVWHYSSFEWFSLFLVLILVFFWFISPVFSLIPITLFLAFVSTPRYVKLFFVFLMALSLGLVNYTKFPESDLASYYYWFKLFSQMPLIDFNKVRLVDPVFYFPTAVLAHIFSGFGPAFILFWTTVIYMLAFCAIIEFSEAVKLKSRWAIFIVFYVAFIGLGFAMTSHLVRQYTAGAFLLYGLSREVCKKRGAYLFFLLAPFVHFSTAVFLPVILLFKFADFTIRKNVIVISCLFLISLIVGMFNLFSFSEFMPRSNILFLNYLFDKANNYTERDAGIISWRQMFEYIVIYVFFISVFMKDLKNRGKYKKIFIFNTLYICLLLLFRNTSMLLVRFYIFCIPFSITMLPSLAKNKSPIIYLFMIVLLITAPIRFFRLLEMTEWRFIENSYEIIFCSIIDFLSFI
jgi:hypothetical protein